MRDRALRIVRPGLAALVGATALLTLFTLVPASADFQNAGPVTFQFYGPVMKLGSGKKFNPQSTESTGTVTPSGDVSLDGFTPSQVAVCTGFSPDDICFETVVVGGATGHLDSATGAMNLDLVIEINAGNPNFGDSVPDGCHIGPIHFAGTTGKTDPPPPNKPIKGVPYNEPDDRIEGRVSLVDNSFAVPASSDCGDSASRIDTLLGLPSPAGSNLVSLGGTSEPILIADPACTQAKEGLAKANNRLEKAQESGDATLIKRAKKKVKQAEKRLAQAC